MRCVSVCACMHMRVSSESPGSYKCSHSLSLPSFPSLGAPAGGGWKAAGITRTIAAASSTSCTVATETRRSASGAAFKPNVWARKNAEKWSDASTFRVWKHPHVDGHPSEELNRYQGPQLGPPESPQRPSWSEGSNISSD